MSIIMCGERFQELATIYLGTEYDFNYNPRITQQKEKHKNINDITYSYNNPTIIFCYTQHISLLNEKLVFFENPFVLITHNSDDDIVENEHVMNILSSEKNLHWFSQNVCIHHDKLSIIPIGVANSMWGHSNISFYEQNDIEKLHLNKKNKVFMNFSINTNRNKRQLCFDKTHFKVPFLNNIHSLDNLKRLAEYEFCICPEGNGTDTHRLWEALYLQSVPIVLNSPFIDVIKKQINPPLVILDDWNDLNVELLDYSKYIFDANYFEKLDFFYYKYKILSKI